MVHWDPYWEVGLGMEFTPRIWIEQVLYDCRALTPFLTRNDPDTWPAQELGDIIYWRLSEIRPLTELIRGNISSFLRGITYYYYIVIGIGFR